MLKNKTPIDKKKALLARKEQILRDLQYYEKRIAEYTSKTTRQYHCSSDSEDDAPFPPFTLKVGPSFAELKQQERQLRTCLQATQELCGVTVLQSEVNVLVQDPVIKGEKPVTEPGTWREVMAECRIDCVPFSITFYMHQPSGTFAPTYYRSLHVLPVKKAQEAELANSVLSEVSRPSDAIEVLRSYAAAFRSRRNTLARLADKYTDKLLLERLPEGGFMLKCANLLSMSWTLENQQSAVAAFHHKMSFDLEYMDESYIKKIKLEHRKLADPSLETDERTLILSNIITICLEAQTQTQDTYESMESDQESVKKTDKTPLSEDIDENEDIDRRKRDKEVMAPPKTIPKKAKPKGKENNDDNRKSVKRASETDSQNAKKAKVDATGGGGKSITDMVKEKEISEDKNKVKKTTDKELMNQKGNDEVVDKEQINDKADKEQKKQKVAEKVVDKKQINQKKSDKVVDKPQTVEESAEKSAKQSKLVTKNVEKPKNSDNSDKQKNNEKIDKKTEKVQTQSKVTVNNDKQKSNDVEKAIDKVKAKNSKNTEKISNNVENNRAGSKHDKITKDNAKTQSKNAIEKDLNCKKVAKSDTNAKDGKNDVPQLKNNVEKDSNPKTVANIDKTTKNGQNDKVTEKNKPKSSTDPAKTVAHNAKITKTANNTEKADKKNKNDNQTTNTKIHKALINKPKEKNSAIKAISRTEKTKTLPKNDPKKIFQSKIDTENKMADTKNKIVAAKKIVKHKMVLPNHRNSNAGVKKTVLKASVSKESQLPQKKLSPYTTVLQKNPVRVSPRMMSKFGSSSATNIQTKVFKPSTNIPRLLKQTRPQSK